MADSHGDSGAIAAAAVFLKAVGCRLLVHLGDICDSIDASTAAASVAAVRREKMWAVRGNNDQALLGDQALGLDPDTRAWLGCLPLGIETPSAVFVHNRPHVRRLGRAALFGDLGDGEILGFLRDGSGRLLFRGHSHRPLIEQAGPGGVAQTDLPGPPGVSLPGAAVITCGSLEKGTVLVWDTLARRVARCRLF
jgi:predicted phosphodiesterase